MPIAPSCPCQGRHNKAGIHYVWMAFKVYQSDTIEERWPRDYWIFPWNYLTTVLQKGPHSKMYHCQLLFWNARQGVYETVTVDAYRRGVYTQKNRSFDNRWTFMQIPVTAHQETLMYAFIKGLEQDKCMFNSIGAYSLFICPCPTSRRRVFCSQLCVMAFQAANLLPDAVPGALSPSMLYSYLLEEPGLHAVECEHVVEQHRRYLAINSGSGIDFAPAVV